MIVRLAMRNASRNPQRTILTALTVVLSTSLLTVGLSWIHGVLGGMMDIYARFGGHVRVVTTEYEAREEMLPLYAHLTELPSLTSSVLAVDGVEAAYPRIMTGVAVSVGEEIGEHLALAMGVQPAWYSEHGGFEEWLADGRMPSQRGEAMVGAVLADMAGIELGTQVLLLGQTQDGAMSPIEVEVVGRVSAGTGTVDQGVFLVLQDLQWLADTPGTATELLVYGEDRARGAALATAIRTLAPEQVSVTAWDQRELTAALLPVARAVQGIFALVMVTVSALGMWNTMWMSVMERTSEIGVLRAMGLGRRGVVTLFVVEGMVIACLGGMVGIATGGGAALWLEHVGVHFGDQVAQNVRLPVRTTMYADVDAGILSLAFALSLCTAWLGTALPAWRAASIQPVEAMRVGQ